MKSDNRKNPLVFSVLIVFISSLFPILCFAQQRVSPRIPELPVPTGENTIGTSVFYLTDEARKSPLAAESDRPREIMVQVWYPAAESEGKSTAAYLTNPALLSAMKKDEYLNLESAALETWKDIQTHSLVDAPIVNVEGKLPLLFFSPGFGVSRVNYTSLFEDAASHGYVVVAIDHPYAGLMVVPDGRVISFTDDKRENVNVERVESMAQDALFVFGELLDKKSEIGKRFARYTDFDRVGMFGHSLGGAVALEVCRISERFKACADMDGSVWGKVETEGVNRPYLVMLNVPSEGYRPPEVMRKQREAEWADVVSKKKTKAYIVKVVGTFHFSFCDFPFLVPDTLLKKNGALIEPQHGFEIISSTLREFFTFYLNEKKGKLPVEAITTKFKEVSIKVFYE